MSLVEMCIMGAVCVVILILLFGLWSSGVKMGKASQTSVALQNAILLQDRIAQDIRQLGLEPNRSELLRLRSDRVSFYKAVFGPREILLRPVRYSLVPSRGGHFRFRREEVTPKGRESTILGAVLQSLRFSMFSDARFGGRDLQVKMVVLDEDVPILPGSPLLGARSTSLDLLARIPIPSQLSNRALAPSRKLIPESPLLPLDP